MIAPFNSRRFWWSATFGAMLARATEHFTDGHPWLAVVSLVAAVVALGVVRCIARGSGGICSHGDRQRLKATVDTQGCRVHTWPSHENKSRPNHDWHHNTTGE